MNLVYKTRKVDSIIINQFESGSDEGNITW